MSIRSRLLLIALLAMLLPVVLLGVRFHEERTRGIQQAAASLSVLAEGIAGEIEEKIQGTAQLHYGLARARDLETADRDACSQFLSEVREEYPQYTGILTIRPDGSLFCDSLLTGRNLDLRDRGYFKAALKSGGAVALEPAFGRLTGIAVLQIAYPVRSATGELRFVQLASLNLRRVVGSFKGQPAGVHVVLADENGTVLVRATGEDAGVPPEGNSIQSSEVFRFARGHPRSTVTEMGRGREARVWAVARPAIEGSAGLYVLAGTKKIDLVAAANRRMSENAMFLAGALLVLFVAVWLVAEFGIRRPVGRIGEMAQRLAAGDLAARIPPPHPRGELGRLVGVLNGTAESLERQRADIEKLNEQLRQSQRLESVGQLTGGVAHDFNNLLTVIMGNAELLAEALERDPKLRALAEMIAGAAQRGAELTQRLLAFARKQALDPKAVDVNQLVSGMDGLLRRTLGEHVEIELVRGAGVWPALVDPGQLESALLNLAINARDAMGHGGRLTIETGNSRLDEDYASRHVDVAAGQYVMVAVSDTGKGIAPEHLARVFEPFFTTKEMGKGTGLGLAMVYGFVKQSGGHVSVYSEPGHGTTIRLYLPRVSGEAAPHEEAPRTYGALAGGSETILLVEDDEMVRRYASEQLAALGYRVVEAGNGPQALEIIRTRADIDLLFTDVVMPGGMSGRELAEEAHRVRPELKVLYASGYSENAIVHHGRLDPGVQLLGKPYRRAEMASAVRRALAGTRGEPNGGGERNR